jgi:hypothetical protein
MSAFHPMVLHVVNSSLWILPFSAFPPVMCCSWAERIIYPDTSTSLRGPWILTWAEFLCPLYYQFWRKRSNPYELSSSFFISYTCRPTTRVSRIVATARLVCWLAQWLIDVSQMCSQINLGTHAAFIMCMHRAFILHNLITDAEAQHIVDLAWPQMQVRMQQ